MSRIYGVVCDGCQKVDAVSAETPMHEDVLPRNGWISVNIWGKESEDSSVEVHVCSLDCLGLVSLALKNKKK
jgi:hypothetical protein